MVEPENGLGSPPAYTDLDRKSIHLEDLEYRMPIPEEFTTLPLVPDKAPSSKWRSPRMIAAACVILLLLVFVATLKAPGGSAVRERQGQQSVLDTLEKTPTENTRKHLILASYKEQDASWLPAVPSDWEVRRYIADDPDANYTVPRQQGREAMVYLTYIIDNYDDLPDYMTFAHGHEKAWHQPEPLPMIMKAISLPLVDQLGWVSLRCALAYACDGQWAIQPFHPVMGRLWQASILKHLWEYVYQPEDPWHQPLPEAIAAPCCAQFAVSKAQTLKRPLEFWKRLRDPILNDLSEIYEWDNELAVEDEIKDGHPAHHELAWRLGGVYEDSWHLHFGMESRVCHPMEFCRSEIFQGRIHCNGSTWDVFSMKNYTTIACTLDE